ncbi:DUF6088 family protein [Sulfitobacter sp. NAS-14.1]|jgi:hypothetical protein|uniref:DUF6088 family protein n=1 Tax=Sulfitobacter sp. (strain NAS-14.1) TaxID=314267 RepID=UPI0020C7DA7B|nr:DUF6088 family protein [Sulfitobacter sp. NAS-14.1]|tara:strand:- start:254 stop:832 length:579 start_codon:yes stop_codon:yes gene_type:complete
MIGSAQLKTLPDRLRARIDDAPRQVWTPADFADIGGRAAVDKALQRMVTSGQLRRIQRGLYDKPSQNALTGKSTAPVYRAVIDAIARRDQIRWLIDGMTAANMLGLTNAVPAKIEVLVDAGLNPSLWAIKRSFSNRHLQVGCIGRGGLVCIWYRPCTGFMTLCRTTQRKRLFAKRCAACLPIKKRVRLCWMI